MPQCQNRYRKRFWKLAKIMFKDMYKNMENHYRQIVFEDLEVACASGKGFNESSTFIPKPTKRYQQL